MRTVRRARTAGVALVLVAGAMPGGASAQEDNLPALVTRLGYVATGDSTVDETMRQGLVGLSDFVNRRTAAALAEPVTWPAPKSTIHRSAHGRSRAQ